MSNCYTCTTVCPPVRGDNPRALASGLFLYGRTNQGIIILSTIISVDLAQYEILRAKVCDFR